MNRLHTTTVVDLSDPIPLSLTFGDAIELLKQRNRVRRAGWNGKGMHLFIVSSTDWQYRDTLMTTPHLPFIAMSTVRGEFVPWSPSAADMLADDWELVR